MNRQRAWREVVRHGAWVVFYVVALVLSSNLIFGETQHWWAYIIWIVLLMGVALAGANSIGELASAIRSLRASKPAPDSPKHD